MNEKFYLGYIDSDDNIVAFALVSEELAKQFEDHVVYFVDEEGVCYIPESKLSTKVNEGGVYVSEPVLSIPEGTSLKEAIDSYGLFKAWREAEEKCWEIFD